MSKTRPDPKPSAALTGVARYPSLRGALWLYLLVFIATAAIFGVLSYNIDPLFLRLLAAIFITAGFTIAAMFITDVRPATIFGRRPTIKFLILSLLAGLAIWVPATWVRFLVYSVLNDVFGVLPPPLQTTAAPQAIIVQAGIIIPLCQTVLFWAYLQRAAEGISKARGTLLTAVLYALYGLFTTEAAFSGVPELLLVGLLAAFTVYAMDSAWYGFVVIAGYGMARTLFETTLFTYLGDQFGFLLGIRWLLVVAITGFAAFILFQVIRVSALDQTAKNPYRAAPRRLWGIPLLLIILAFALGTYGEVVLRQANAPRPVVPRSTGSTTAPIVPTPGATPQP
ncbi:MAG: hypothetical protein IT324_02990 [Anaerolineae bacterium]|nr:hypothetical protein [Anaerolineae bacterium]